MSHEASSIRLFIRDRLGWNTRDVLNLVHELEEKGASLRVLEPAIDTGGPTGRMVLTVLGMVAEMELGFIRDGQRAGIDAAKEWAPLRSPRPSGASEETSIRRSRPPG
jgi:DNA invertase Pin-like site-specific DNA recombinase